MEYLRSFLQRLSESADRTCIDACNASYSYAELLEEVARWKALLQGWEVGPGTVVGIRADYSLSSICAFLAVVSQASIAALIPSGPQTIPANWLEGAFVAGVLQIDTSGDYNWQPVTQVSNHPLLEGLCAAGAGGMVIFTSGTTGRPKAALHSIERFLHKFCHARRSLRTLAFLQFDHIAGLDTLFYTLSAGGTLILPRKRDPWSVAEIVESRAVEVLPVSPSFLRMLCADHCAARLEMRSLKVITYGSEPMDGSTLLRLSKRFPDVKIRQKYGSTELGSPRTHSRGDNSLWLRIASDLDVKVIDGILWVRSDDAFLGYLNAQTPVTNHGWFCTEDIVETDGEWIRILGRASDIINVGGEKVSPTEVENVILQLQFVQDVAVFAESHALLGQIVGARVSVTNDAPDARSASRTIRAHCRKQLIAAKVPVRIDITRELLTNSRHKKGGLRHQ